jgi:hypothetical protein
MAVIWSVSMTPNGPKWLQWPNWPTPLAWPAHACGVVTTATPNVVV